jgi:serine/threonine protein kinase HipA of HipAB toxin-antitoxin module
MMTITFDIDEVLLAMARQYADEHETTLEALIAEHLALLADRAGRRLTVREQTYVDCAPSEEVKEQLRAAFQRERARREKAEK